MPTKRKKDAVQKCVILIRLMSCARVYLQGKDARSSESAYRTGAVILIIGSALLAGSNFCFYYVPPTLCYGFAGKPYNYS